MIKILHTSDWHLGKKLYKKERWPEQELFLQWLIQVIKDEKVSILIIAGDIFDTPVPPTYALKGLFQFYKEVEAIESLKKVLIIGGNHDSGKLIEAPRALLGEKFHLLGRPSSFENTECEASWQNTHKVSICDDNGSKINFALFPFFRSSDLLTSNIRMQDELSPDQMLLESIKYWLTQWNLRKSEYNILIGHHLFGSFLESQSEQGVSLSGLATIPLSIFEQWDLLCLGHIHKPQCLKREAPMAYYSGSPIPMRFSEKEDKSILLYELRDQIQVHKKNIPPFRPLIQIDSYPNQWEGELEERLKSFNKKLSPLPPYLELTIHFNQPNPSYIDHVRTYLAQQAVELLNYYQIIDQEESLNKEVTLDAHQIKNSRIDELFALYLQEQNVDEKNKKNLNETFQNLMQEISQESNP